LTRPRESLQEFTRERPQKGSKTSINRGKSQGRGSATSRREMGGAPRGNKLKRGRVLPKALIRLVDRHGATFKCEKKREGERKAGIEKRLRAERTHKSWKLADHRKSKLQ